MAENTNISWCHHTANLWWGCTAVHAGCDNCYAEAWSKRFGDDIWGNDKYRKQIKSVWNYLNKFQKIAKNLNEMHTVFVGSMMDIFEKPMPLIDSKGNIIHGETTSDIRHHFFENIYTTPNLIYLFLTKRPSNINKMIPESWKTNPPSNVMFGTSIVNQETANKLVPQLLKVKGHKFLSIEPQLDGIILDRSWIDKGTNFDLNNGTIDWVINGGESGQNRRNFDLKWAYALKEQCVNAGVPYFFKQIDKVRDKTEGIPIELQIMELPKFFK